MNTRGHTRLTGRALALAVVALWVAAAALAGYYFANSRASEPATAASAESGLTTTTSLAPTTTTTEAPTTTTTEAPTTTTTTEPPPLLVAAGGDVLGDRGVGEYIDRYGGESVFEKVRPFLAPADVAFVNLEGPISDTGSKWPGKKFTFRARPALTTGLVWAGIDVVSLANNHSMDYGSAALLDCIERLDAAGVAHPGGGANLDAATAAAILDTPAGTVGVIAASQISTYFGATSDSAGTNAIKSGYKQLISQIEAASKQTDFLIVSFHWGTEYDATADPSQQSVAHMVIDAGADLVLGHHPHVIQGLEIYKDRLIVYSLGDFVFDHYSRATGEAFVLQVTLPQDGGPPSGRIIPVYLHDTRGVPAVVYGSEADAILDRLTRLSADLGLEITRDGDEAVFGTPPSGEENDA